MVTNFCSRLVSARNQKKLTQDKAANILKIAMATLNRYENGHRTPGMETLGRMAKLYDCSAEWLMTGEWEMKSAATSQPLTVVAASSNLPSLDALVAGDPGLHRLAAMAISTMKSEFSYNDALRKNVEAFDNAVQMEREKEMEIRKMREEMAKQSAESNEKMDAIMEELRLLRGAEPEKKSVAS